MKKVILIIAVLLILFLVYHNISNDKNEVISGDKIEFVEKTILGKKLVFYDNQVDFKNYYVVNFTEDGNYIKYGYYYLKDKEHYLNLYKGLYDIIVDYNYKDLLIRTVEDTGKLTYKEYYNMYNNLFKNGVYVIVE